MTINWQERALAAEKTVVVLKKRVLELYNKTSVSTVDLQLEKAKQREEEIRRKRELAEVRNQELEKYNESLENEVALRAEVMKTILNNVRFGFLLINRSCQVLSDYSLHCEDLFQVENITGQVLPKLMRLSEREVETFKLALDQVYEDSLPEDVALNQLPNRFYIDHRIMKTEANVVRTHGKVESILFTISDITDLKEAQNEASLNRILIGVLRNKEAFIEFIQESKFQLGEALALVNQNKYQNEVRRNIHTIKGNAAAWGLFRLIDVIHHIEDDSFINVDHIMKVEESLRDFVNDNLSVLGIQYDNVEGRSYFVEERQIEYLNDMIKKLGLGSEASFHLRQWTKKIQEKSAAEMLGPVDEFVQKLAGRLGKKVKFEFIGRGVQLDSVLMKGVLHSTIHLIRNSVDHGIEDSLERSGKSEMGHVTLEVAKFPEGYKISVSDDGRGIDADLLLSVAIDRQLLSKSEVSSMSESGKLELVFMDGLSSVRSANDISGRGVGMSAVKAEVYKVSGSYRIESKVGQGTRFTIIVPKDAQATAVA